MRSIPGHTEPREVHDAATLALLAARRSAVMSTEGMEAEVAQDNGAAAKAEGGSMPSRTPGGCSSSRKPYHVILTATAQVYQQWQCRIMYHHWKQIRDADPAGACTEMTGFTRLVASPGGQPDGLEGEIPSVFTPEYDGRDLNRFHGYRVINRPRSVVHFLRTPQYQAIKEEYIFIAETDHIILQPIPNHASKGSPMAYVFGYMGPNPAHASFLQRVWPAGGASGYKRVQSIGPSPVLIHKTDLEIIAQPWNDIAVALKTDPQADSVLGWVIEMWGYSVAAASIGLRHQEYRDFQVEPGALSTKSQLEGFPLRYWIFHYTYQFEYMLDGTPCQPWTIGEFSLDKRHFSDVYPPYPLPQPPEGANKAAFYLLNTFNNAMAAIGDKWPRRQPPMGSSDAPMQSLYGRRRLDWFSRHKNGFETELRTNSLVQRLVGSQWNCANGAGLLTLDSNGNVETSGGALGKGKGRWGSMNDPTLGDACPIGSCVFFNARGGDFVAAISSGSPGDGERLRAMGNYYNNDRTPSPALKMPPHVVETCTRQQ